MNNLIYFLDDEELLGCIFKEFMEAQGYEVQTFVHPNDAILACKDRLPDVMLIDYRLPEMTGEKVAQSIHPKIKKILLTGELTIAPSYPFEKVILKPYKLNELYLLLSEILENNT